MKTHDERFPEISVFAWLALGKPDSYLWHRFTDYGICDLDHEPDWRAMAGLVEFLADSSTLRLAEENAVRLPLCHSPAQVVAKALRITDPDKDPPDVDDLTALRASARPHSWDHLL